MTGRLRPWWHAIFVVAILMIIIGVATDDRDVDVFRHKMESRMAAGDYEGALEVGRRSDKTDSTLTMLRVEALGRLHRLGSDLFTYPLEGSGSALARRGGDYLLSACLIDRQLDRFVQLLPTYYNIDDHLPRHYQEALILYKHLRSQASIVYDNSVLDADYEDFRQLQRQYPQKKEQQLNMLRNYEGTYWYYYEYENIPSDN